MKPSLSLLLTLLVAHSTWADTATAGKLLREGKAADALCALRGDASPEAAFWRGRALIDLGRLIEAARELQAVQADHQLYPYAAKALLYCAWKSNSVDFAVVATPMATSSNTEIAGLATAALAEFWLRQPKSQDNSALERLRALASEQPELKPLLRLLEIENLRQRGEFDKAIEQCRVMESDRELPLIMRHRARLALSEVYYSKEAAVKTEQSASETALSLLGNTDDELQASEFDDGKGEETLLHFISSHPESPLLEEAFRRLHEHNAFEKSEYARIKLKEWMMEPLKSRRASQALLIQQHLLNPEEAREIPLDVTCANTAAATCPNEPATRSILLEQTRWFLERNQTHEALLYLGMIQGDDVFRKFYETQLLDPSLASTARAYMECARQAPESLRSIALVNALLCALKAGDTATQDSVFSLSDLTDEQHFRLLQARAAYWLQENPSRAQSDIAILLAEPPPSADLRADVEMDQAYLQIQQNPSNALDLLQRSEINNRLTILSDDRQLRFFALQEEALRRTSEGTDKEAVPGSIMNLIRGAAGKVRSPQVVAILTLHLASLQSIQGQHEDALRTLHGLIRKYPKGDFVPRALYMSARECEFIGSINSLKRAAQLYTTCADRSEELATKAGIHHAAVLLRLGMHEETEHSITRLLRNTPDMRAEDKALAYAVLANSKALLGTPEGRSEAVEIAGKVLKELQLPRWWKYRALLHHGTLCARAGMNEESLRDYEEVLGMEPAKGNPPPAAEWHILYSAGSGAVLQLLQLKRYAQAAEMSDRIADWNKAYADPAKRKQFADWAQFIRQTNFVNNPSIPF